MQSRRSEPRLSLFGCESPQGTAAGGVAWPFRAGQWYNRVAKNLTMPHLLGLDHKRLTYLHNGRRYRLTDVAGNVLTKILA
jgi:hypothetical protein